MNNVAFTDKIKKKKNMIIYFSRSNLLIFLVM